MRLIKLLIKYIIVIGLLGSLGGLLNQYLHPLFYDKSYASREGVGFSISIGLVITFITYNLYLFTILATYNFKTLSLAVRGVFCLITTLIATVLISLTIFGITFKAVLYILSSLGISSYIIPYLDKYLSTVFKLNKYLSKD